MGCFRLLMLLVAVVWLVAVPSGATAQIFVDGFEKGIVGNKIGAGDNVHPYWVGTSPGTATYAAKPEQFEGGFTVARFYDQNDISGQTVFLQTGPPTSFEEAISGQVFTMSFDFLEIAGTHFNPPDLASAPRGLFFGFSHDTAFPDLNDTSRAYAGQLANGTITRASSTDAIVNMPVTYDFDVVHTAYLLVNDSANPVNNYVPGHSIASKQADIWILKNGQTDPVFAGTVQYNPAAAGTTPKFMGFRSFIDDRLHIVVDNLLLNNGASFSRNFDFGNRIPGDVDNNGIIDETDLQIIRDNFFESVAGRQFGDLDENGFVDYADFRQWKNVFESQNSGAGSLQFAVPEPTSAVFMVVAICQLLAMRVTCRRA